MTSEPKDTGDSGDRTSGPGSKDDKKRNYDFNKAAPDDAAADDAIKAPQPGQSARSTEQERLVYHRLDCATERQQRYVARSADHFEYLRQRLEEFLAKNENEPIVLMAVRNETGIPYDQFAASWSAGAVYARGKGSAWGALKWASFESILTSFIEASSSGDPNIGFVDAIPISEKTGDVGRLIDNIYDDRVKEFEARLKERGLRFFLIVIIDGSETTSRLLRMNPGIWYLPWTDLWLSDFLLANKNLSADEIFSRVGPTLRNVAEWRNFESDRPESNLHNALRDLSTRRHEITSKALTAIQAAIDRSKESDPDEAKTNDLYRSRLIDILSPGPKNDPVKTVMFVIAAFAGGTRVNDYYNVCRMLLPDGPAEIMRLPPSRREIVLRERQSAENLNRDPPVLPGWDVVFDHECDAARTALEIHVRAGQVIELDGRWKMIDPRDEIARAFPGVISAVLRRIREKRLFLDLPEASSELLIDVVCAIREACGKGFDDFDLANALTGAELGLGDLGPLSGIVAQLYPGLDPQLVLQLINGLQHERFATALGTHGDDPEAEHILQALEITPENLAAKLDTLGERLREESVARLTRRLERMRFSSGASEVTSPIIPSMLDILKRLLSPETYVALLTYMIASSSEVDVKHVGRQLVSTFAQCAGSDIDDIVIAIHRRLRSALAWPDAPHSNWFFAFDPIRAGKPSDDRLRALAVLLWDLAVNYDVPRRILPYDRMRYLRIVHELFPKPVDSLASPTGAPVNLESGQTGESIAARIAHGFLAVEPASWLRALLALEELFEDSTYFDLAQNIRDRIQDAVWAVMTGVAEQDADALEGKSERLARDVLVTLCDGLDLGFVRDFDSAAGKVVKAIESNGKTDRRWLALYGLFWPAMIAHWRFAAFGLEPFEPGSHSDRVFRDFLGQIVTAAPARARKFRDGFKALAAAAETCAQHADDMRLKKSAALYQLKSQRLKGLAEFFSQNIKSDLVAADQISEDP